MTDFVCIGVPYFLGERIAERTEVEQIKASGIVRELDALWVDIDPDFDSSPDAITAVNRALAETVAAHSDRTPIVFAGDCCCALGALKGLERHQPTVLWYDAHGDFNTPETTPSGFLGGMPLAWLVGRGDLAYMEGLGLSPIVESKVTIADARNLDPEEGEILRASKVKHLHDVNELREISWGDTPLYIHFDVDVIDSAEMPALLYPEPDGPTLEQTLATLHHVVVGGKVVGILFSLFNGSLDGAERALENTLRLVRAVTQTLLQ